MRIRAPRWILLGAAIVVAAFIALAAWAFSSPPGSSPDDDYHMASIWCAAGDEPGLCTTTSNPNERVLSSELLSAASCFAFDPDHAASCPRDKTHTAVTTRGNWNGGAYPPLYYATMHVFAGEDLSASIVAIRLANAALYLGVVTALFFLLPRRGRIALLWGALLTSVPLAIFLVPSINPSSWAVISATGLWVAAWGFLEQRGVRKALLGILTVLLLVVGAGARSDSAAYGVLALIAASVLAFRRDRRYQWSLALPVGLIAVAVAFFLTSGQSAVVGGDTVTKNASYTFTELLFINLKALPQLLSGVLGTWGLGWLDTYMPGTVWVTMMLVFAGVVFWGLQRGHARKWIALAGVGFGTLAVPLYILLHDGVVVGNGVQPRYVLPLIIMFAGIAVYGFSRGGLGMNRLQLCIVGGGLVVAQSVALHVNIRRYVTGLDVPGVNLDRNIEWWWNAPISPMGIWALGTVAFAVVIVGLLAVVWPRRMDTESTPSTAALPPVAR